MKPRYLYLAFFFITLLLGACTKQEESKETQERPLIVGMELEYPPFETTNLDGEPSGVSVDLANAIGEKLGREVQIESIRWTGLIPALQSKKIDMIISSMAVTEEREKQIDFSIPYATFSVSYLAGIDTSINSAGDLKEEGVRLAVKNGTIGHNLILQGAYPNAEVKIIDQIGIGILEIIQEREDALLIDSLTVLKAWKKNKETTKTTLERIPNSQTRAAVGFNKDSAELRDMVNVALREFIDEGGFDPIEEKYFAEERVEFEKFGVPFFFDQP